MKQRHIHKTLNKAKVMTNAKMVLNNLTLQYSQCINQVKRNRGS